MSNGKKKQTSSSKFSKKEGNKMLSAKELVQKRKGNDNRDSKRSPVEKALDRFENENGYDFLDMMDDEKLRQKHQLKQMQKESYDDDDFLDQYQKKQGD